MEQVCATCKYAEGFGPGPGISGADEGVMCANHDMARYLDSLQKSNSYEKEFHQKGFINIFRVEAVASSKDEGCQFWAPQ